MKQIFTLLPVTSALTLLAANLARSAAAPAVLKVDARDASIFPSWCGGKIF